MNKVRHMRLVVFDGDDNWIRHIIQKSLPEGKRELGGFQNFITAITEPSEIVGYLAKEGYVRVTDGCTS